MAIWKKYPYTDFHDLNLDWIIKIVKELKEIVDQIDVEEINRKFSEINAELTEHETEIHELQSAIPVLSDTLRTLSGIVANHTDDLASIHEQIDGVIDRISEAVTQLQGEIGDLETDYNAFKTATNTSIYNLNQAAFDPSQIVMSNYPFNFAISTLNGNKYGIRIVVDEAVSEQDSIQWVDGGDYAPGGTFTPDKQKFHSTFKIPRFYNSGNQCHLVIPNVFPIKYGASINWSLYFYANRWIGATSPNVGICKVGAINFTDLMSEGGYTNPNTPDANSACFNSMELFANEETGCYDLHIYNGRNGKYCWIQNYFPSSIMILPLDLGTMSQAPSIQKYFNLLNTYLTQANSNIDSKITSAVNDCKSYTRTYASTQDLAVKQECLLTDILNNDLSLDPYSGVSVVRENTTYKNYEFDTETRHYKVTKINVSMVLQITGLTSGVDFTIGKVKNNYLDIERMNTNHYLSLDIMGGIGNGYCTISSDGTIAVNITSDSANVTVRIYGYVLDHIKTNL